MIPTLAEYRAQWEHVAIPYGECLCGCGRRTNLAAQSSTGQGLIRGEPRRFCRGHGGPKRALGEVVKSLRWIEEDRGHDTPCWIWVLHRCATTGYAKMFAGGRSHYAHRYYYEQEHGELPREVRLDHLCRVRECVNPSHLEPVTNAENCRRGDSAKLTADDVREIRSLCAQGWQQRDIARAYGVTQPNVSQIHLRKSWADLEPAAAPVGC